MAHSRVRAILAAATMVVAGMAFSPALNAGAAAPETPARHCTLDIGTGAERCFTSFEAAIVGATHGRVTNAPNDARIIQQNTHARAQLSAELQNDVVIGSVFQDANYGGSSLTISGSGLCPKDDTVNFAFDLDDGWKNTITSVQAWGNCWLWLYPEPGLNGDRDGPFKENTASIGSFMDNRTQSIGFS